MSTYVKNYSLGEATLDAPYIFYKHILGLTAFGGERGTTNLSIAFNSRYNADSGSSPYSNQNYFSFIPGMKITLQKKVLAPDENSSGYRLIQEDGSIVTFYGESLLLADDESGRELYVESNSMRIVDGDIIEEYDTAGNITAVRQRTGTTTQKTVLTYSYTDGKLVTVTDCIARKIVLDYDASGHVSSISVKTPQDTVAWTMQIVYAAAITTLCLCTGVDIAYTRTTTGLQICSKDHGASVEYEKIECIRSVNTIIKKWYGSRLAQCDTYTFLHYDDENRADLIEKKNLHGVRTRYQYQDAMPEYAYEADGTESDENDMFYQVTATDTTILYDAFKCDVGIFRASLAEGRLRQERALRRYLTTGQGMSQYHFECPDVTANQQQWYTVSGWFRSSMDMTLAVYTSVGKKLFEFTLRSGDSAHWRFFCYDFSMTDTVGGTVTLTVKNSEALPIDAMFGDIRITPPDSNLLLTRSVLVRKNGITTGPEKIDLNLVTDVKYVRDGSEQIKEYCRVTFRDIDKRFYKQATDSSSQYLFLEYCTEVIDGCTNVQVGVFDGTQTFFYPVDNYYVGTERTDGHTTVTKYVIYRQTGDTFREVHTVISRGSSSRERVEKYNFNAQPLSVSDTDCLTEYTRDANGNVTQQSMTSQQTSMVESFAYSENGDALVSHTATTGDTETYLCDPFWGNRTRVTAPDGSQTDAEYDTIMAVPTQYTFTGNGSTQETGLSYNDGAMSGIRRDELQYAFTHENGRMTGVTWGSPEEMSTLLNCSYNEENMTKTVAYSTGGSNDSFIYDKYGRLVEKRNGNTRRLSLTYDLDAGEKEESCTVSGKNNGSAYLRLMHDAQTGKKTYYQYSGGRVVKASVYTALSTSTLQQTGTFTYDAMGRTATTGTTYQGFYIASSKMTYEYVQPDTVADADDRISGTSFAINGVTKAEGRLTYDGFRRVTSIRRIFDNMSLERTVSYLTVNGHATPLVASTADTTTVAANNCTTGYTYDAAGRVASTVATTGSTSLHTDYFYDSFGRLVRENDETLNGTFVYRYDSYGNVTEVRRYAYTPAGGDLPSAYTVTGNYVYGDSAKKDRLTSYNGKAITYIGGCLLKYNGRTYRWEGTQLKGYSSGSPVDGTEVESYRYNALGQRTGKDYTFTPGRVQPIDYLASSNTTYRYDESGRLVNIRISETYKISPSETFNMTFLYDVTGVSGCIYTRGGTTATYYFGKNIFGDITEIYNTSGNVVAVYRYDAYGNCSVSDIGGTNSFAERNPFRYRGYIYDNDTGWYFLGSRYYSPEFRRFISPDAADYLDPTDSGGVNLYAYCRNDPVNYSDPTGNLPIAASLALGFAIGFIAGFAFSAGSQLVQNGWDWTGVDWGKAVNKALVGGALGLAFAAGGAFLGPVLAGTAGASVAKAWIAWGATTAFSATAGAVGYVIEERMNDRTPQFSTAMMHAGIVALESTIKFGVGGAVGSVVPANQPNVKISFKDRCFKFVVGQEFSTPFTFILDLLRNNLFWED